MLREIAFLMPLLSTQGLQTHFAKKAKQVLDRDIDSALDYRKDLVNLTWVFGQTIRIAFGKKGKNILSEEDSLDLLFKAINRWSWSEYVLMGLLKVADSL